MADKNKRISRTHAGQYEIFVAHLNQHDQLRTGAGDPSTYAKLWDVLTTELNAYGAGPQKSSGEWQTTFRAWKYQIRHKARAIKKHGSGTGGGPPTTKHLTDIEERALAMWGMEVISGIGVGCVGFGSSVQAPSTTYILSDSTSNLVDFAVEDTFFTTVTEDINDTEMTETPPAEQPTVHTTTRPLKKQRSSAKVEIINELRESDQQIASAINNLANRMGDIADQMKKSNELFTQIFNNQQAMLTLMMERNNSHD